MVKIASTATISGSASQVTLGPTPEAAMKTKHRDQAEAEVEQAVSTTESGITRRGNCILRTMSLAAHHRADSPRRRIGEEPVERQVEEQELGVVGDRAAEAEDPREHGVQDREQHQRADQRPQVAEDGAEVAELELGHGQQPREVEEALGAAAERRGASDLPEGGDVRGRRSFGGRLQRVGRRSLSISQSSSQSSSTYPGCWLGPQTTSSAAGSTNSTRSGLGPPPERAVDRVAVGRERVLDLALILTRSPGSSLPFEPWIGCLNTANTRARSLAQISKPNPRPFDLILGLDLGDQVDRRSVLEVPRPFTVGVLEPNVGDPAGRGGARAVRVRGRRPARDRRS